MARPHQFWNIPTLQAALTPADTQRLLPTPPTYNPNSDPGYVATAASTQNQLANTEAQLGVSFDANGNPVYNGGAYYSGLQNFGIDQNGHDYNGPGVNPFSQMQLMKNAFENRKRGTVNSYAANGQLYSGALNNEQTADATNYAQNYNVLQRNAQNYYSGLVSRATAARDNRNITLAGAGSAGVANFAAAHANDPAPSLQPNTGPAFPSAPRAAPRASGGRVHQFWNIPQLRRLTGR